MNINQHIAYWLRLGLFTGLLLACGLILIIHQQVKAITTSVRHPQIGSPTIFHQPYDELTLTSRDGLKISAWYIQGTRSEAIIVVHGLNANRQAVANIGQILSAAGYPVLLLDLRGNGLSESDGYLTYGYREAWDVEAAVDYLAARPEIKHIGAFGVSMGGATVVRAAASDPRLEALVIQSSYSSLPAAVDDAFDNLVLLPAWPFKPIIIAWGAARVGVALNEVDSARDLAQLQGRPVFIIHGTKDELFPMSHAQRMFEAAHDPKTLMLVPNATHHIPLTSAYRQRFLTFWEHAFTPQ